MLPLLLSVALAGSSQPAMVTMATGTVTLIEGKTHNPAPAAPFLLAPGQLLELAEGAHVVILRSGGAFSADGPKKVDAAALAPVSSSPDAVGTLLARQTSLSTAGASRAAGLSLVRPVPSSTALAIGQIRWRCDACGAQPVEVRDLRADTVIWIGEGEEQLAYAGPPLAPGVYLLRVGGNDFNLRVTPAAAVEPLLAPLASIEDPADRAASQAGALLLAGYPTDALAILEGAGLTDLVAETERLAGVGQ